MLYRSFIFLTELTISAQAIIFMCPGADNMNKRMFISGIIIFAIAGFVFMAGYRTGGIVAIIGLLVALAGMVEKDK